MRPRGDPVNLLLKCAYDRDGAFLSPGRCTDQLNRLENPAETGRLQREDGAVAFEPVDRLLDDIVGDRADVAELLRQDEIGVEPSQEILVECVDAAAGVRSARDMVVDLAAAVRPMVEGAPRDDREPGRFRGEIALVGHGHQLVAASEREDDLRCAREQRADFETGGHSGPSLVEGVRSVKNAIHLPPTASHADRY